MAISAARASTSGLVASKCFRNTLSLTTDPCFGAVSSFGNNWAPAQQARGFGAGDLKTFKERIKSIESLRKITKAMKMVAGLKMKKDHRRLEMGTPFAIAAKNLLDRIPAPETNSGDNKQTVIVVVSSDKGLCGSVNSAVARKARETIIRAEAAGHEVQIVGVGEKIRSGLQRLYGDRFDRMIRDACALPFNFGTAAAIAERIVDTNAGRLVLIYNHYRNAISFDTRVDELLNYDQLLSNLEPHKAMAEFEFEPESLSAWRDLYEFYVASSIYGAVLDSTAAEQASRMTAMDTASKNAEDMVRDLRLASNRARQAKITMELIEIISGANAL